MFAQIETLPFIQNMDPDVVGAALILTVIGTFGTLIAVSVTLIEAIKSIVLARFSKNMIQQLLDKGYTPQEVEQLVHGQSKWAKMSSWMKFGRDKSQPAPRPVPPIKQPMV